MPRSATRSTRFSMRHATASRTRTMRWIARMVRPVVALRERIADVVVEAVTMVNNAEVSVNALAPTCKDAADVTSKLRRTRRRRVKARE